MKTEICNVHIFDGNTLTCRDRLVIEGGVITDKTAGDITFDGGGGMLLPGLIDAHAHLNGPENLAAAARWGVTTMLDMAARSPAFVNGLMGHSGVADILTCYTAALFPVPDPELFVEAQVALGASYIKIIIEDFPVMADDVLSPATIAAIVRAAHSRGKRVVAHAASDATYRIALDTGVDILTHIPLNTPIPAAMVAEIKAKGVAVVPTAVMMRETAPALMKTIPDMPPLDFEHVKASLHALVAAGVPLVAGTDANLLPFTPANIPHGTSLHDELEYFVQAGMSPAEALHSATGGCAKVFGIGDRGIIEPGRRADLLLVDGDPTKNIADARHIKATWVAGVQVERVGE